MASNGTVREMSPQELDTLSRVASLMSDANLKIYCDTQPVGNSLCETSPIIQVRLDEIDNKDQTGSSSLSRKDARTAAVELDDDEFAQLALTIDDQGFDNLISTPEGASRVQSNEFVRVREIGRKTESGGAGSPAISYARSATRSRTMRTPADVQLTDDLDENIVALSPFSRQELTAYSNDPAVEAVLESASYAALRRSMAQTEAATRIQSERKSYSPAVRSGSPTRSRLPSAFPAGTRTVSGTPIERSLVSQPRETPTLRSAAATVASPTRRSISPIRSRSPSPVAEEPEASDNVTSAILPVSRRTVRTPTRQVSETKDDSDQYEIACQLTKRRGRK